MFMQKFKASLRFLGVLLLRTLLGIVVGYLWLFAVFGCWYSLGLFAYLFFHFIMDVRMPRDLFDHCVRVFRTIPVNVKMFTDLLNTYPFFRRLRC